jgi:serine/threonine protein kinase
MPAPAPLRGAATCARRRNDPEPIRYASSRFFHWPIRVLRTLGKAPRQRDARARPAPAARGRDQVDRRRGVRRRIRRLYQEARVVSKFSHPNIVTLFDAIEHDGGHYLVLEYVDGCTLAQLLRRKARSKIARGKIAIQVAEGLPTRTASR